MYDVITLINLQLAQEGEEEEWRESEIEREGGEGRSSVTKTMFSPSHYPSCEEF